MVLPGTIGGSNGFSGPCGERVAVRPFHRSDRVHHYIYILQYVTIYSMVRRLHSFYLDPELSEGLSAIRDRDGVLPSEQVRRAIRRWLEWKGYKPNSRQQRKRSGKAKK